MRRTAAPGGLGPLGTGHGGVGNLFGEVLTGPWVPSLIEFAHAVGFSRETFDDDRTVVAVWPRTQVSAQSPAGWRGPGPPNRPGGL
jgi:hypothetical protein